MDRQKDAVALPAEKAPVPLEQSGAQSAPEAAERLPFGNTPAEAVKKAERDQKLVFVLQAPGDFVNGAFADEAAEAFRKTLEADRALAACLVRDFVPASLRGGPKDAPGRGVRFAIYFCLPDTSGTVVHAVAGPSGPEEVLAEAEWALVVCKLALDESSGGKDGAKYRTAVRNAHVSRFRSEYDAGGAPPNAGPERKNGHLHDRRWYFPPPNFFDLAPGAAPKSKPIPLVMPKELSDQGKVHWLLQSQTTAVALPTLRPVARIVWQDILRQR